MLKVRPQWLFAHLVVFSIIALPAVAYGADYKLLSPLQTPTMAPKTTVSSFSEYAKLAFQIVVGIAGLITVIILIIGGIEYVSSGISGNEAARTSAHKRIWDAITGLILALSGYFILYTINPKLANFELKIPAIDGRAGVGSSEPTEADFEDASLGDQTAATLAQYGISASSGADLSGLTHADIASLDTFQRTSCGGAKCINILGTPSIGTVTVEPTQTLMNTLMPAYDNTQWSSPRMDTPITDFTDSGPLMTDMGTFVFDSTNQNFVFTPK